MAKKAVKTKKVVKKTEKVKKEKPKTLLTVGKRKRAIARASFKKGSGIIKINSKSLELVQPEMIRLRIQEPLKIAGDVWKGFDVKINVKGGGPMSQAEAVRQALARGIVELVGGDLRQRYLSYDRNLLVYDPRRTEPHKPPHSSWGARRYKQRSKR
jgi:small subunit ribosomal protein S9